VKIRITPVRRLEGRLEVPGDKSISHRAVLFGALARGRTEISGFLESLDCLSTLKAVRLLGAEVTRKGPGHYLVDGAGLRGLTEPDDILDCGNSGTSARLLLGVLAGQPFWSVMTGDESLRRRPMGRVADPLRLMGATVVGRDGGKRLPLCVGGARPLRAIAHRSPVASAQVKTALLLAGLWADGPVSVEEPALSRDHTERMLGSFGARLELEPRRVTITPGDELRGRPVVVPGDISSAAFFLVAASIVGDSRITIENVGVNPTRTGLLDVLGAMGAVLTPSHPFSPRGRGQGGESRDETQAGEPAADLTVSSGVVHGTEVGGELIPRMIDEIPVLAVAACAAGGVTRIRDAAELRVKESDRIHTIATELGRMGADIVELPDGLEIRGSKRLRGAAVHSAGDHRVAMALAVAGLVADGPTVVDDTDCIATSFPGFVQSLNELAGEACAVSLP
jgi:3-phosphoshikimate 1-carboxyvinyltransferase